MGKVVECVDKILINNFTAYCKYDSDEKRELTIMFDKYVNT